MTPARRRLAFARYLYRQMFVRRPYSLLLLIGALAMCSMSNPFTLFGAATMLGGLPLLALSVVPVHLPVARRTVLLLSWLPALAVLLLSLGASRRVEQNDLLSVVLGWQGPSLKVSSPSAGRPPRLDVPGGLWQLGGADPSYVELPGGERIEAERRRVFGLPIYAHNPYTVPEDASFDVAAVQVHRALIASSDLKLTLGQVEAHLAHEGPAAAESLQSAVAQLGHTSSGMVLLRHLLVALMALAWTCIVLLGQPSAKRSLRRVLPPWTKIAGASVGLALFAVALGFVLGVSGSFFDGALFPLQVALGVLMRGAERFPWMMAGFALASLLGAGRLLMRRVERLELPVQTGALATQHR